MERTIEWFVALTSVIIGASHIIQTDAWVEVYERLHRNGRPGAFVNGALHLVPGAAIVAGHAAWSWPAGVLTAFGWLLLIKALVCFVAPDIALRSMARAPSPGRFRMAGVVLLFIAAWAGYCIWRGSE
jgi:hypothetical protein